MSDASGLGLLLFDAPPELELGLGERMELVAFHSLDEAARGEWLSAHGERVCAVFTNGKLGCSGTLIDSLPNLGLIAIFGVGFDRVALDTARRSGVIVTNTPDVLTDDVADLAVGLIISLLRRLPAADRFVRNGEWSASEFPLEQRVSGKQFGILGLGRIGQAIAIRLSAFGTVAYTSRSPKPGPWMYEPDLLSLARWSDVLVVACAANDRTRSIVDADVLQALGANGVLINVARGSIVDEEALAAAILNNTIAGAALDVFEDEPRPRPALIQSDRTVLTAHIGSATVESWRAMTRAVLASLDAFLAGDPVPNLVIQEG